MTYTRQARWEIQSNHRGQLSAEPRLDPPEQHEEFGGLDFGRCICSDCIDQLRERLRLERAEDEEYNAP